jgi:hypothetical protein
MDEEDCAARHAQLEHNVDRKQGRELRNARLRERYANDAAYREKVKAKNRKRRANEEIREKTNAKRRERYATDEEYRERTKALDDAFWLANRERICAKNRHRWATDPAYREKYWVSWLKSRYGITLEDFNRLLEQQNYVCAICQRPFDRRPHVDHCHLTNWVRGLLCYRCNPGLGHFHDNPIFLFRAALYALRWYLHLLQVFNKEEHDMMTNDDSGGDSKASRVMRKAILHELHQQFGVDEPPPADKLQAVARALVNKAAAQDVSAIKEILDRIDGKTPSIPTINDLPQLVNLSWKQPSSLSEMSPTNTSPSKKSKSTTGRAPSSSPSTGEPSASPAS